MVATRNRDAYPFDLQGPDSRDLASRLDQPRPHAFRGSHAATLKAGGRFVITAVSSAVPAPKITESVPQSADRSTIVVGPPHDEVVGCVQQLLRCNQANLVVREIGCFNFECGSESSKGP